MNPPNPTTQTSAWATEFAKNQRIALMRLRRMQKHLGRTPWKPSDGEGRPLTKSTNLWTCARWKTVYQLWDPIKEGRWPPKNVQLSDCWVYIAVKLLSAEERAAWYSADFDIEGNIRPSRVPCGNPPVIYAHGLYCLPVYRHSYVLCGEKLAAYGNWILGNQRRGRDAGSMFTLGLVCVPPDVIPSEGPNIERYLFFHGMANQWDLDIPSTETWVAAEAHQGTFDRWCLADHDKATMLYSMYPTAEPNYALLPVKEVTGFTTLCHADYEQSSQLMGTPEPFFPNVDMGDMFAAHNGVFSVQRGNAMAGPSNQQFVNVNYNNTHSHTVKEEPLSPTMTKEEFLAIPLASEEQRNSPTVNQFPADRQGIYVKTEDGSPSPTNEVERALAAWLGDWPPPMNNVRKTFENYLQYLDMDPDMTAADVERHAGFIYNHLKSRREMQENNQEGDGK